MSVSAITSDRILKLGYSYRASKALLSAVELDVFTQSARPELWRSRLARAA